MNPYLAALELVQRIDTHLEQGGHYRACDGSVITTLDQAVNAILTNNFPPLTAQPLTGDTHGKNQNTRRRRPDLPAR